MAFSSSARVFSFLYLCHLFLLLLLCLCLFFSFHVVAVDAYPKDDAKGAANDVRALIQFKKCITSDPLSLLKNWDAAAPNACNWTGISCSTKHLGRVVQIHLENATLRGSLSPHLSNLSFLEVLVIYNHALSGILFIFRRAKAFKRETPRIGEKFLKISKEELGRATANFSLSNLLGEGSHGKVYRGVLASGMVVAVKCFSCANQTGSEKNFKKECRALGKVKHRNILKIITVVWSEELKALVMPFMSNGNLHSLLHSKQDGQFIPLVLPMRVKILTELAKGLGYLHHDCEFQVIHCDIKPENVLLDDDMTVKLSDFGISHLIGDSYCPTASSSLAVMGSIGYIAPEYGIGERIAVAGDVYSFGVVTLEVMTRLKPTHEMFSGDVTLPLWISMALKGKSAKERRETIKDIIKTADEGGGGIDMDKDDEMSAVESILLLGLRCACHNASMRPSMKEVESFLESATLLNPQSQMTLPNNLEEVIRMVELQPSLYHRREEAESSTFSS